MSDEEAIALARKLDHLSPGWFFFAYPVNHEGSFVALKDSPVTFNVQCPDASVYRSDVSEYMEPFNPHGYIAVWDKPRETFALIALSDLHKLNPAFDIRYSLQRSSKREDLALQLAQRMKVGQFATNDTLEQSIEKEVGGERLS